MNTSAAESMDGQASHPAAAGKKAARAWHRGMPQEQRRILIVVGSLFAFLGAAILLATTTDLTGTLLERASLKAPRDRFGIEERNASIVLPPVNRRCRQIAFNNDTGEMTESNRPCESGPRLDDKGVPVPEATIRRMDSIRQGFTK